MITNHGWKVYFLFLFLQTLTQMSACRTNKWIRIVHRSKIYIAHISGFLEWIGILKGGFPRKLHLITCPQSKYCHSVIEQTGGYSLGRMERDVYEFVKVSGLSNFKTTSSPKLWPQLKIDYPTKVWKCPPMKQFNFTCVFELVSFKLSSNSVFGPSCCNHLAWL